MGSDACWNWTGMLVEVPRSGFVITRIESHNDMHDAPVLEESCRELIAEFGAANLDHLIPTLAQDKRTIARIEHAVQLLRTTHELILGDSRRLEQLQENSVHLVVTSPPYWTLKRYNEHEAQLGHIESFEEFIEALDLVWHHCFRALVPGGRLVCVVGDVCLSRRKNNGRHTVVPLHAAIQEHCRRIGFDNLAAIVWHKIANATYEVPGNTAGFLGKPYEPNAVIKNDIEFIVMERKPGGYRSPTRTERLLSVISAENYQLWFRQIWADITGASTRKHPAPYPLELAERLVRMFSFVGDTVLDPFMGTATTNLAAARWGRNSVGVEVDPDYFEMARSRIAAHRTTLFDAPQMSAQSA
ncbi:MAG: site-specific DNA-methyltransferase [Phycisphaerales bacterium]|nr:site-specific DNA-methyltransferase [Phycisphaerales bacterium]